MGSFSVWHWLIVLLIVVLVFGTKKLKNMGSDLGSAVKGFKDGVKDGGASTSADDVPPAQVAAKKVATDANTVDVEAKTSREFLRPRRARGPLDPMIDFGFDKIALIGAVALIVIGPEKLPRVARTVGHFIGKAQRYVADVKAEVNRSIELEELKKMKGEFEDAARNVERSVHNEIHQTKSDFDSAWGDASSSPSLPDHSAQHEGLQSPVPDYKHPKKNWRLKRGATPQWYKQRHGVRGKAQSGAARVARFRPPSVRA